MSRIICSFLIILTVKPSEHFINKILQRFPVLQHQERAESYIAREAITVVQGSEIISLQQPQWTNSGCCPTVHNWCGAVLAPARLAVRSTARATLGDQGWWHSGHGFLSCLSRLPMHVGIRQLMIDPTHELYVLYRFVFDINKFNF